MPVYDYKCRDCGVNLIESRSIHEPGPAHCMCGGDLLRVFSAPAVQFKGPGFYKTDSQA